MPCGASRALRLHTVWLVPLGRIAAADDSQDGADVRELCWGSTGVSVPEGCCQRQTCSSRSSPSELSYFQELCCAVTGFGSLALPWCDAPLLKVMKLQLDTFNQASGTTGLQALPVSLFNNFILLALKYYLGAPLDSSARLTWRLLANAKDVVETFCPLAAALSSLLKGELALALSRSPFASAELDPKLALVAYQAEMQSVALEARLRSDSKSYQGAMAILAAGRQRLSLWRDEAQSSFADRSVKALTHGATMASHDLVLKFWRWVDAGEGPENLLGSASAEAPVLQLEREWLQRISWRQGPNALCWTPDRQQQGATHEACCARASAPKVCWDLVYQSATCCPLASAFESSSQGDSPGVKTLQHEHRCGDLSLAIVSSTGQEDWVTNDAIREFHTAVLHQAASSSSSEHSSHQSAPLLWPLISSWPDEDLRARCPEVWLLARLLEAVVPTLRNEFRKQNVQELLDFYRAQLPGTLTGLPGMLLSELGIEVAEGNPNSIKEYLSEPAENIAKAWQHALHKCSESICSENMVEEDKQSGLACSSIPVRSEFGGVGRTTNFGRLLWCSAKLGRGATLDLYAGSGDTAALLVDGLKQSPSGQLISFELSTRKASMVADRLRKQGAIVQEVQATEFASTWQGFEERQKAFPSLVTSVLVASSTAALPGRQTAGASALQVVCDSLKDLGLVLLDPDVEMPYTDFANDWRVLEAKQPRLLAIYNTNLPGGAGWLRNRLLTLGTYVEIANGHNDGGTGEPDELLQIRAWSLLLRVAGATLPTSNAQSPSQPPPQQAPGKTPPPQKARYSEFPETVQMVGEEAKEWIESHLKKGWEWGNTTWRAVRGGEVLRIHKEIGDIVPVEVQRPTQELLVPPTPEANQHLCFADADSDPAAQQLRLPCFINCEGPDFDPKWAAIRKLMINNAAIGYPADEELLVMANFVNRGIVESDDILIRGRSRFMARLRHEYTHDGHLEGFCMFGIAAAAFFRGRHMLDMQPREFQAKGKKVFAPSVGLDDMDVAFTLISDSNSKGGIEFSFLENSAWPVRLEGIVTNLETQKVRLGKPFSVLSLGAPGVTGQAVAAATRAPWAASDASLSAGRLALARKTHFRLCGVGDHLTATFDALLMAEAGLAAAASHGLQLSRDFLGRFCPQHQGQGHQCRQRCELLGAGCGGDEEESDPVAEWLGGVIHAESLEELPFDLQERHQALAKAVSGDTRLSHADLLVCSHPTMLCVILAQVSPKPVFVHASSTLLYGLPCTECDEVRYHTNLRHYGSSEPGQSYLRAVRQLLRGSTGKDHPSHVAFVAEGRFLAEQIKHQVGVEVPWAPPLALYAQQGNWRGGDAERGRVRRAVVLRSRFFVSLMGELLRSLLRELVSINFPQHPMEVTFLGADNQFDEQWLSLQQIAGFDGAVLWPNDLHQRTFHEAYRMGMPLFMPDAFGLFRAQRMSNWGYASYGGRLVDLESSSDSQQFPPWWNSFNATPEVVVHLQNFADWEQMPHIQRFASLPSLITAFRSADLSKISSDMLVFHKRICREAIELASQQMLAVLR
eukprot:TRINITY_DN106071_c0_g1_i1.p1 TRINITY_DN106071_c0_g1~~TRINITY_DN106071_c0_g1_i1.p1  ORF type:complete len:1542 (+),score=306.10 TRINITY_DN106071_c0_g1_i1:15-4640(+)